MIKDVYLHHHYDSLEPKAGDVVFEIGAHIGSFAMKAARLVEDMIIQGLKLIPALILGFAVGDLVFIRCDEIQFRKIVMAIIVVAGILLILSTWHEGLTF